VAVWRWQELLTVYRDTDSNVDYCRIRLADHGGLGEVLGPLHFGDNVEKGGSGSVGDCGVCTGQ
jgi:hypothetical protein